MTFRQSATDADNHLTHQRRRASTRRTRSSSRRSVQVRRPACASTASTSTYHNNRNGDTLDRADNLVSPRAGIVFKPIAPLSLYGSYSVSYLPSSGDQFSSLTTITEQVKPEQFNNYEVGAKWDVVAEPVADRPPSTGWTAPTPASTDPNDPTRIVQTGSQRTNGFELGVNGQRHAARGASPAATPTRTPSSPARPPRPRAGAHGGPGAAPHALAVEQLPGPPARRGRRSASSTASDMFAAIDNTVTLPGYTRVDAAAFVTLTAAAAAAG